MSVERVDTIVIGGGQAGLAMGQQLARRGSEFVILEAGDRIGDSWRNRWQSLRLFTPAGFSSLPGLRFPTPPRDLPSKDEVADYLEAYAARFELPVRFGSRVERLTRDGQACVVSVGARRLEARQVVVASGAHATPRIPTFADRLEPRILHLHSSRYRDPDQLREGAALVVGAGNSGAEIALDLVGSRPVWLSGRDVGSIPLLGDVAYRVMKRLSVRSWPGSALARLARSAGGGPLGGIRPVDLDRAGIRRVPRVSGVRDGQPELEDGRVLDVENVVWCTGFASDYGWIDLPVLDAHGAPLQERGVVPNEPGLYFLGLPFQTTLASHLLGGVGADAGYIADRIMATARGRRPPADEPAVRAGTRS